MLDSQVGNFIASKLGDRVEAQRLIDDGKLDLIPMSDVRGYDTSGMKVGVYVTEGQNLSLELLRLALQRVGEDSIVIIDGDNETQIDLPEYTGANNGMRRMSEVFRGEDFYGEVKLMNSYRSRIASIAQKM